jgi:quercetin dioxygenase-like cupin family protein
MIIKGKTFPENQFRKVYELDGEKIKVKHFVVRTTLPENPFVPHKHEQEELWYIIEGRAVYTEDGLKHDVGAGDLIQIKPWVEHGMQTDSKVVWICLG